MKIFKNEKKEKMFFESYNEILGKWKCDFEEVDIETSFGITHCILCGQPSNPPLLMFHGVGDNSAVMWVLNIDELSKHFYCIAVDTLGGPGKSIPNDNYKKYFSQLEWQTEILNKFKLEKTNLVGVSNGAYMAYNLCVKQSQRILKAVCIEGGMVKNPFKAIITTLKMIFPEILIPTDKNMKRIFNKLVSPNSKIYNENPEIIDHIILAMNCHNRNAMFLHKIDKYDDKEGISQNSKLLFLLGDYKINEKNDFIDILKAGDYNFKVIKNAGHGLNHEQYINCNQEIISFLKN